MTGWQPISTAPVGGEFLVWVRALHNDHEFFGGLARIYPETGLTIMAGSPFLTDPTLYEILAWHMLPDDPM